MNFPADHSWAYYNSLQQLFYFATVFIGALHAPSAMVAGHVSTSRIAASALAVAR